MVEAVGLRTGATRRVIVVYFGLLSRTSEHAQDLNGHALVPCRMCMVWLVR
jgi:hypothetical protein